MNLKRCQCLHNTLHWHLHKFIVLTHITKEAKVMEKKTEATRAMLISSVVLKVPISLRHTTALDDSTLDNLGTQLIDQLLLIVPNFLCLKQCPFWIKQISLLLSIN